MPLPLTYDSITKRCSEDITEFTTEYKTENYTIFTLSKAISYADMKTKINSIIDQITKTANNSEWKKFNYHNIYEYDSEIQEKLWIYRTYICYQLLIYLIQIASGEITDIGFKLFTLTSTISLDDLADCRLGIFGSITPTSDIDIGIQYSGTRTDLAFVWWLVCIYEDLYLNLCEKPSLDLDIETYADYISMPGKIKKQIFFYLSTAKFELRHFEQLLPFIGCSILRNAIIAEKAVSRFFSLETFISNFTFPIIPDTSLPQYSEIQKIWSKDTWKNQAKKIITESQTNYELQRNGYYKYAREAELSMLSLKKIYNESPYEVPTFDVNSICDLMMKISHALVYREESYICPPTVVHIVRILQASKHNTKKRICDHPTEPDCSMGYFGYLMSMLEQVGYIDRFKKTYCKYINFDKHKCDKKVKKYNDRYTDSIYQMHKLQLSKVITQPSGEDKVTLHFSTPKNSQQKSKRTKKSNKSNRTKRSNKSKKSNRTKRSNKTKRSSRTKKSTRSNRTKKTNKSKRSNKSKISKRTTSNTKTKSKRKSRR